MNEIPDAIKRAKKEKSAEAVIDISLPTAANRIYIAGENLASAALLATGGSAPRDHGKLWNGVQKLSMAGKLKRDYRRMLETSYRLRIKGDYGRDSDSIVLLSRDVIERQIKELKEFLSEVRDMVK